MSKGRFPDPLPKMSKKILENVLGISKMSEKCQKNVISGPEMSEKHEKWFGARVPGPIRALGPTFPCFRTL